MSLFDEITSSLSQSSSTSPEQHKRLVQGALEMFGHQAGLSSLVAAFEQQGLGHIAQSWISNGANHAVSADQIQRVLGQNRIQQLASKAGISPDDAAQKLSGILPVVVDKLSPGGKIPQAA